MKALKILLAVMCTAMLVNFLRRGDDFPLPRVLPLLGGRPLNLQYALGGLALLALMLWGLHRLNRSSDQEES